MPRLVQKIGMLLFATTSFAVASTLIESSSLRAQEQEQYNPPFCLGQYPNGFVKCNYDNADNYVGYMRNGVPDGRGVYVYADSGDRYEGEFRNGRPNGRGIYIFSDDARYTGIFQNGNIIRGTAFFADGSRYEGTFQVVTDVNSGETSSQPQGRGVFIFANGTRYEGEFFAGDPFGKGVVRHPNGVRCDGQFFNQNLDGKGTCTYPDGSRYEGEFRQGRPHGNGTLYSATGEVAYRGAFREGQPGRGDNN